MPLLVRLLATLLLLTPARLSAQDIRVDGLEVRQPGIYAETLLGRQKTEGTAMGDLRVTTESKLVEETETICARLGVTFGFGYTLLGAPLGQLVRMTAVTQFPPQGMTNASGRHFPRNAYDVELVIGSSGTRTFTFEEPWEIVPGTWTFEFQYQGRKLGEKSFTVMAACPIA